MRSLRRTAAGAAAALILAAGAATVPAVVAPGSAEAAGSAYPALFGTNEQRSTNVEMFPKWRGTLQRYFAESGLPETCGGAGFDRCHLADWQAFLDGQQGRDPLAQIEAVNAEMNARRYVLDPPNWGVPDYWATPLQFFRKNGDCEDFAIAKFMSLRALGWPNEALRIAVVKDMNLQLMHAVLIVYHEGRAYVLDNQIDQVMPAQRIRHYHPVYSLNEESWWLHRG